MNFETFVALIALAPERREAFLADMEAALDAEGLLSDDARRLIPTLERLARALEECDFPTPPRQPVGG